MNRLSFMLARMHPYEVSDQTSRVRMRGAQEARQEDRELGRQCWKCRGKAENVPKDEHARTESGE